MEYLFTPGYSETPLGWNNSDTISIFMDDPPSDCEPSLYEQLRFASERKLSVQLLTLSYTSSVSFAIRSQLSCSMTNSRPRRVISAASGPPARALEMASANPAESP